jgi:hypothetical protein
MKSSSKRLSKQKPSLQTNTLLNYFHDPSDNGKKLANPKNKQATQTNTLFNYFQKTKSPTHRIKSTDENQVETKPDLEFIGCIGTLKDEKTTNENEMKPVIVDECKKNEGVKDEWSKIFAKVAVEEVKTQTVQTKPEKQYKKCPFYKFISSKASLLGVVWKLL